MSRRDEIITEIDYLERELEKCKYYDHGFLINNMSVGEYHRFLLADLDRQNDRMVELNKKEAWEKEKLENEEGE